jgi:CheY-like chemotaxis protein
VKPSVLIIEDDDVTRDTFVRTLRLEGYEVESAGDGAEGVRIATARHVAGIVTDLRMPLVDGIGFLSCLRQTPHLRDTPVALVTGDYFISETDMATIQRLGARLLFKPIWIEDLVALVDQLVTGDVATQSGAPA